MAKARASRARELAEESTEFARRALCQSDTLRPMTRVKDRKKMQAMLKASLKDHKLQADERRTLRELATVVDQDLLLKDAFDLARATLSEGAPQGDVFEWLEDVSRLSVKKTKRAEAHFSPGADCRNRIAGAIGSARDQLDICVFTITDDRLVDALFAAEARGVKIRIISDNDKALDMGSDVERLRRGSIQVRLDRSEDHMHHKFALIDGEALLNGSYNWTRSAFQRNRENILITENTLLVDHFQDEFDRLWDFLA